MKAFIVLATLVACSSAAWVFLPLPEVGNRPEILPPSVDPIHPNVPEPDPIFPEEPSEPILPPGIQPEVPIVPPKPELPKPEAPLPENNVHSEILNFPSDDDPQIRVHVNIKQEKNSHRPARSIFNWPNIQWPEIGVKPEEPEIGNKPEVPELPEIGNKPELPGPPEGGILPEVPVPPPIGEEIDGVHTYIYPNVQHQLVKLRVQYNKQADEEANWKPVPFKLEFPEIDNRPALPEWGHKPEPEVEPPHSKYDYILSYNKFSKNKIFLKVIFLKSQHQKRTQLSPCPCHQLEDTKCHKLNSSWTLVNQTNTKDIYKF